MRERIRQLEKIALALEPNSEKRVDLLNQIARYAEAFLQSLDHAPAYIATDDKGIGLYDSPISEGPLDLEDALNLLKHHVNRPGINPASGNFLGYIPGGGLYFAALGDYLAAITNRYAGVFFASPGAVRIERMLVTWLRDLIGYPEGATGDLTSGGSIANLAGIVTAREAHNLRAKDFAKAVVYLSAQTHHSVDKALRIAGMKECVKRYIPLDQRYHMQTEALKESILADKKQGLTPWLIIASAGTTDTGAVDPLPEIAEIAGTHQLWLHVDGAYGAAFALCEAGKRILRGIEQSDSVVIDPHKGLFLPYGTGAILVKEGQKLHQAHYYQDVPYMQDALAAQEEISPADLSPELTRHFRGLRLWLPLKLLGVAPFRAALEEKLLLARYFYQAIQEIEGFEVGPDPDLSVVTFRYAPKQGDANTFNQKLAQLIQEDGRIFLSTTMLAEKFTLRLAILSFRSHLAHIEQTIEVLREKARLLETR